MPAAAELVALECSRCSSQEWREIPDDDGAELYCVCGGRLTGTLTREPSAPLVTSPAVAHRLAGQEYGYRWSSSGREWMRLSRGSDGGMHYRGPAYSEAAARGWCEESTRRLARAILSGRHDGTLVFESAPGRFYLG